MGSIYAYFTIFESVNAHIKEKVAKWWPFTFRRHYGLLSASRSGFLSHYVRTIIAVNCNFRIRKRPPKRQKIPKGIFLRFRALQPSLRRPIWALHRFVLSIIAVNCNARIRFFSFFLHMSKKSSNFAVAKLFLT